MKGAVALVLAATLACDLKPAPPPGDAAPVVVQPVRLRGTLLARDSSLVLVACGTVAERVVTALPASGLRSALVSVVGAARDSMYVELLADTAGARVVVHETLYAMSLGEGSRCDRPRDAYEIEALGNEPFWRVTLDGTQLVLERPDYPREIVFVADSSLTRGTLTTVVAHRNDGRAGELKLSIVRDACRDGMSDAWYPFRAEVRFGRSTLRGCARR